jgi:uncharacterized protein YdhG (YjbR/CyaY superfamily)
MAFESHDSYFVGVDPEIRTRLVSIQEHVEALLPNAVRCISYNMPAFKAGRVFLYFAAFKKHIGIYPPVTQDVALVLELDPYRGPKGNLSFAHSQPLPLDLIGRVAVALHRQYNV